MGQESDRQFRSTSTGASHAERRSASRFTDQEFADIARAAADLVEQRIYVTVGKSALRALLYLAGAAGSAALAWLHGKGLITFGSGQ